LDRVDVNVEVPTFKSKRVINEVPLRLNSGTDRVPVNDGDAKLLLRANAVFITDVVE
jgi:hypothetical protein